MKQNEDYKVRHHLYNSTITTSYKLQKKNRMTDVQSHQKEKKD